MSVENNSWVKYWPKPAVLNALKILIGGLLLWYLWTRISDAIYSKRVFDLSFGKEGIWWLVAGTTLSFLNWFLEAKKWQLLTSPFQNIRIPIAYKSVLAGLSTGLITPNRLGNFIGRLSYIMPEHTVQGTVNTQIGNLSQFIITIMIGLFGLTAMAEIFIPIRFIWLPSIMLFFASWLYFNPKIIIKLPFGKKIYTKWHQEVDDLASFSNALKWRVLFFSLLRYLVFIIQFICLFKVFGIVVSEVLLAMLAAITFLITTAIPGIFMGKLLVRESATVFVFTWIGLPVQTILAVSFLLWLINLAIPAAFGWYFWLKKPTT